MRCYKSEHNLVLDSQMQWAGHMIRMKDERFPKRCKTKSRLSKTRKPLDKMGAVMGGLPEDRPNKGRGRRQAERKGQQQGTMEKITKAAVQRSDK